MTEMALPAPEDIECYRCDEVGTTHHVSRATWICENCGADNSLWYVLICEAEEREE